MRIKKLATIIMSLILAVSIPFVQVSAEESETLEENINQNEAVELTSPSAILMEESTGKVLYEKNAHEQRAAASITKIMTLCLVFEAIENGQFTYGDTLTASAHASSMGGSDIWLKEGEQMSVEDLIKSTIIMSANDAAVVLAEAVAGSEEQFVVKMNEKAQELGMTDTVFKNCNGLDEEGHLTSAYDIALMSRELMKYEKVYEYTLTWIDYVRDGETQLVNTNKLIRNYSGITGLKTGTTSAAGSCISATAERDGLSLIAVILGAESTDNRFSDATKLLDHGFANWKILSPEIPEIGEISLKGGMKSSFEAKAESTPSILMKFTDTSEVTVNIELEEDLQAPISTGDVIGKVKFVAGENVLDQVDIIACEDIEQITIKSTFIYLLQNMFCI